VFTLEALLHPLLDVRASDLHLKVGAVPHLRVDGSLLAIPGAPLGKDDLDAFVAQITSAPRREEAERRGDVDFALSVAGVGRFRVHLHRQRSSWGIVLRKVRTSLPPAEVLGLPQSFLDLAGCPSGLVVVTGAVASGRSTTAATLVDHLNERRTACIVTIEDPIEYLHSDKRSIVTQREVGSDSPSYAHALRRVLRQDPDVLFVDQLPDAEVASAVLAAAGSGRLVITSITALSAIDAVTRLVDLFPEPDRPTVRQMLAGVLRAVTCQRLMVRGDGRGRVAVVEMLLGTEKVTSAIASPHTSPPLSQLLLDGRYSGMVTFDESLTDLALTGAITRDTAMTHAADPGAIAAALDRHHEVGGSRAA
jgi:twitching motility protein PilT